MDTGGHYSIQQRVSVRQCRHRSHDGGRRHHAGRRFPRWQAYTLVTPDFVLTATSAEGTGTALDAPDATILSDVTIVPNTADAVSLTLTPTLEFTGTDSAAHSITYEVQVHTDSGFASAPVLLDSYSESNNDSSSGMFASGSVYGNAQSFHGVAGTLDSCKFCLAQNAATGNVLAKLYAHSGSFGSTGVPTGTALAVSDVVDASSLSSNLSTGALATFTFSGANRVTLAAGTDYIISVEYSGTNAVYAFLDGTSPTHGGNLARLDNASVWSAFSALDLSFYIYTAGSPTLDKLSSADAGFLNTVSGGDTDPFNSGQKVSYTAQSALSAGTYYWHARGKHVGASVWSDWTTTRSFSATGGDDPETRDNPTLLDDLDVLDPSEAEFSYDWINFIPPIGDDPETRDNSVVVDEEHIDVEALDFSYDWINAVLTREPQTFADGVAEGSATALDAPSAGTTTAAVVREGPRNLLTYTESFDAAAWAKSRCTITANATTDPLGGSAADKLTPTATGNTHSAQQLPVESSTASTVYYTSVYAKAAGYDWLAIGVGRKDSTITTAWFDLANGVVGSAAVGGHYMEDAGNGWWRCFFPVDIGTGGSANSPFTLFYVANADNIVTFGADGTSGIYLWGAQREVNGASAYEAVPTVRAEQDAPAAGLAASVDVAEGSATATDTQDGAYLSDVTVVLNTADAASLTLTPTLEFTGTDALAHDLTYEVQVSSSSVFDPALVDSYAPSSRNLYFALHGGGQEFAGQSFPGANGALGSAVFALSRDSGTTGNCYAELWSHSGTYGTSSVGATLLATSNAVDVSAFGLALSGTPVTFTFSGANRVALTSGTNYVIGVRFSSGDGSHNVNVAGITNANGALHGGNAAYYTSGPSWTSYAGDLFFSAYTSNVVLDKLSAVDTGFLNTVSGGDTDPFNSGQKISFTVQAGDALTTGTYYWRVRAKHVGASAWSDWTTTRSFVAAQTYNDAVAEGSATATDTTEGTIPTARVGRVSWIRFFAPPAAGTIYSDAVAEGTATAADTPSATEVDVASIAEGAATATDTPSAAWVTSASVAEGTATATDTPSTIATLLASVVEGTATAIDVPTTGAVFAVSVAEGTATATDTPSSTFVTAVSITEGTATATDTPSARATFATSLAEGSATAVDTPSATFVVGVNVAEGTATATDTPSAAQVQPASVAEGTATAADTPSAKATFAPSVAEVSTSLDTPTAGTSYAAFTHAEGSATAVDTPSPQIAFVVSVVEVSTSLDTQNATWSTNASVAEVGAGADTITADLNTVLSAAVAEGTTTAVETVSATGLYIGVVAEGSATALDTPSAVFTAAASVTEISTAADTPDGIISSISAELAEGTATAVATPVAAAVFQVSAVESSSGADTPSSTAVFSAVVAESGAGTDAPDGSVDLALLGVMVEAGSALDTPFCSIITAGSVAEGTASAQDIANATAIWRVFIAEAGVGIDTPVGATITSVSITEGTATASDTQSADRQANAGVIESSIALDTQTTIAVLNGDVAEGSATAVDLVISYGQNEAFIFEVSYAVDTVSAEVPDRTAIRDPRYQELRKMYVFVGSYQRLPIYTPVDVPEPEFPEEPETEFEFTKPVVPTPTYISPEKRVAKF